MEDIRKRLIASILNFLRDEFRGGRLSSENAEGLEVAIQCLESIYEVDAVNKSSEEPSLLEIYKGFHYPDASYLPDANEDAKKEAEQLKMEGNNAMSEGRVSDAVKLYTRAIELNGKNAVYYCNRAAAYSKLNDHNSAIFDCKKAIEIDPNYSKAYGRLGLAYCGLECYSEALRNYKRALDLEPGNEGYQKNYELAQLKVAEVFPTNASPHSTSGETGTENEASNFPVPNAASTSGIDLSMIFTNPQIINIASQILADPSMQNMMTSMVHQEGTAGMEALLHAGQRLAQHMQHENPTLVTQLRQTLQRPDGSGDANRENSTNGGPRGNDNSTK